MSRFQPMRGCYVYFFYDSDQNLLYVGKTIALKKRMGHHFCKDTLKLEIWKQTIDRFNIILHKCHNLVDLELYETYFINKYNPIYNQEKVYGQIPTFDLPYLEPIIYEHEDQDKRKRTFKYYCLQYINNVESRENLPLEFQVIKEIYEKLGVRKMQALLYKPIQLQQALFNYNNEELAKIEIRKAFVPGFYSRKDTKRILTDIYNKIGIIRGVRAKEIEPILNIRLGSSMVNGTLLYGYIIQEKGVKRRSIRPEANGINYQETEN